MVLFRMMSRLQGHLSRLAPLFLRIPLSFLLFLDVDNVASVRVEDVLSIVLPNTNLPWVAIRFHVVGWV